MEVARVLAKEPRKFKLKDFLLKFDFDGAGTPESKVPKSKRELDKATEKAKASWTTRIAMALGMKE